MIVDIKGVGKAQFPDGMPIDDIRSFLRNKYYQRAAQGQSDILSPAPQTVSPYEPTLTERLGGGIAEGLKGAGLISDNYGAQQIGKNVTALGEFLPGIGDAAAGDEFGRALQAGNYGDAALAGVGTIPIIGDMAIFAGALAKNADLGALKKAQTLELQGKGRDEIWKETGWFNDKGNWKFEVSDHQAQLTEKGIKESLVNENDEPIPMSWKNNYKTSGRFDEYIDQPELNQTYPGLKGAEFRNITGAGGQFQVLDSLATGKPYSEISVGIDQKPSDRLSTGLHELQHAIQNREGFQRGGNPREFKRLDGAIERGIKSVGDVLENRLNSLRNDKYYKDLSAELKEAGKNKDLDKLREISRKQNEYLNKDKIVKQHKKDLHDLYGQRGEMHLSPMDKYQRLAGEAEARLVQTRMNMTPEERRARPPWQDLDVPEDELIYRGGNGGISLSTNNTNNSVDDFKSNQGKANQDAMQDLLSDPSQAVNIGQEKGKKKANGISKFVSPYGSTRYVEYVNGQPVSALQVMSMDGKRAKIANVYTVPTEQKKGRASKLMSAARKDFKEVKHSDDLTELGAKFANSVERISNNTNNSIAREPK